MGVITTPPQGKEWQIAPVKKAICSILNKASFNIQDENIENLLKWASLAE